MGIRATIDRQSPAHDQHGFTLIELTVVVALISIVLVFALPRFDAAMAGRSSDRVFRWVDLTCRQLRTDAVRTQRLHRLRLDLDAQRIGWEKESESGEAADPSSRRPLSLSGDVRLLDVVYAGGETIAQGRADIRFLPAGYADLALIHFQERGRGKTTLRIEPFLADCRLRDGYAALTDRFDGGR